MAAEEGQVIGCHSLEQFTLNLDNAKETQKLVVIDFTATWCGPCRAIAPIFTEWAKKYPHVLFLKVDVDEMQVIAQEMKVEAMPTFVFMKDGKEIDRVVGGHKDKILAIIAKHPPSASAGASSGTATA